jgi:putative transposase
LIREICEDYGFEIIEIEIVEEHVHILISFPKTKSIGEVVRIIKSKRRLWSGEIWEDGTFVRTVGDQMTRDVFERYIVQHRSLEQGPAQLDLKLC